MYIYITDPHPGRCRNLRPSLAKLGSYLRCLDYEHVPHRCHFEQEGPPANLEEHISSIRSWQPPAPKAWVAPDDAA